jgi:hypothetical protein
MSSIDVAAIREDLNIEQIMEAVNNRFTDITGVYWV